MVPYLGWPVATTRLQRHASLSRISAYSTDQHRRLRTIGSASAGLFNIETARKPANGFPEFHRGQTLPASGCSALPPADNATGRTGQLHATFGATARPLQAAIDPPTRLLRSVGSPDHPWDFSLLDWRSFQSPATAAASSSKYPLIAHESQAAGPAMAATRCSRAPAQLKTSPVGRT